MGPYSHIIVANQLEAFLKPSDPKEYYWGAIAPDVRYLVKGMNRAQTHLSPPEILDSMARYPQLTPFLQGYLVHCLTDLLELPDLLQRKFPLSWQKKTLSPQQCTVVLEFFNILRVKPMADTISESHNVFLQEIGIDEEKALRFARELNTYLPSPSLISIFTLYRNLRVGDNSSIEKYRQALEHFQENWFRKNLILCGLHIGKINQELASLVKQHIPDQSVCA